ncbi:MAG: cysteine desulfurase, partial [Calditrichaeota bacterium]
ARESEIYFVSGGTEADNLVIQGVMFQNRQKGNHLITTRVEHPAVLNTCKFLEKQGFSVTYLKVDQYGQVDPQAVKDSIRKETVLVSIIHANNEVGTINDLESIASITQEAGVWLHSDAVQSFGKIPLDVQKIPVDFLSLSGHKIYGPKGIGVVYARRGTIFRPLLFGGSHEHSRRAGTENVPAIVGLGKATQLMVQNRKQIQEHVESLRNYFEEHLKNKYPEIRINGHPTQRLFTTSNVAFPRVDQETLLLQLDMHGIAVSSGSACSSGSIEPSHVLQAMGIPAPIATRSLRFSFGKFTTRDEVDYVLSVLDKILTPKRNR